MISKFSSWLLPTLACSLLLVGCGGGDAPVTADQPQPVGVLTIQPRDVELEATLPGRTAAYTLADIRPKASGVILQRLFVEGSDVKAGQALYQIDPASARASLQGALASRAALQLKAERYRQLVAEDASARQDYDDTVSALKQADAAVSLARISHDDTRVVSPVSGRIGKSAVTVGALVTANQETALATVQQLDPIYVDLQRSSSELLQLRRDLARGVIQKAEEQTARIRLTLEDGSAYPLEGKLEFSDVTVDERSGMVALRAVFPNPKHVLLPGMFVQAHLLEGKNRQGILVPQDTITHDSQGQAVALLVDRSGKAEARTVQVARAVGNCWLVSSGLAPGEQLIVRGLQFVRPGIAVKPVPLAPASIYGD